jgi:hypothetical protein
MYVPGVVYWKRALARPNATQYTLQCAEIVTYRRHQDPSEAVPHRKWDTRPLPQSDAWAEGSAAVLVVAVVKHL